MTASRNDVVRCPWCQRVTLPIWVHGHMQCQHCHTNIDPCCGGEQAQEKPSPGDELKPPAPKSAEVISIAPRKRLTPAERAEMRSRAALALGRQSAVRSPCVGVCLLIRGTDICAGCFRSVAEIRDWMALDDTGKREVMAKLDERRVRYGEEAKNPTKPA